MPVSNHKVWLETGLQGVFVAGSGFNPTAEAVLRSTVHCSKILGSCFTEYTVYLHEDVIQVSEIVVCKHVKK